MIDVLLRIFSYPTDYNQVLHLWQTAGKGIRVQRSDQPNEILKKLARDPDLFLVACNEGKIIGTVIAGFDGRRGMIYHLVVASEFRNQGIASKLMDEVEKKLVSKGCIRCYLFVTPDNTAAMEFYEKHGWEKMKILPFAKDLVE